MSSEPRPCWYASTARVGVLIAPTRAVDASPSPGGRPVGSDRDDLDGDVPAGGLRVRAQLVGAVHELLRLVLVDARQADGELDAQAEALALLADADLRVDDGVGRVDAH